MVMAFIAKRLNHKGRGRLRCQNPLSVEKQCSIKVSDIALRSEFLEFGSSDWTRTSDIRINSPPFYRLNYRGIV